MNNRTQIHLEKINYNLELLSDRKRLKEYEYLYKIIKNRLGYLFNLIDYSKDKIVSDVFRTKDNYIFFVSNRYLARRYKKHTSTWNRNINIFVLLGLINKYSIKSLGKGMASRRAIREQKNKASQLKTNKDNIKPITFYTVPKYNEQVLSNANNIAKQMLEANFKVNSFSKIWIIKIFGADVANKVFNDDREVTEYSNHVADKIEQFIIEEISEAGYTTKKRILDNVKINYDAELKFEYGFIKQKDEPKSIVAREFDRSLNEILSKNSLKYRKANRELKEKFELESYNFIIYKENS